MWVARSSHGSRLGLSEDNLTSIPRAVSLLTPDLLAYVRDFIFRLFDDGRPLCNSLNYLRSDFSCGTANMIGLSRLGVDQHFSSQVAPDAIGVARVGDPDHFSPAYFGPGFRWQLPDLEASEAAYRQARAAFEADGRRVLDATVGGNLAVFPKGAYGSLFEKSVNGGTP
jgi:hypothetical protein